MASTIVAGRIFDSIALGVCALCLACALASCTDAPGANAASDPETTEPEVAQLEVADLPGDDDASEAATAEQESAEQAEQEAQAREAEAAQSASSQSAPANLSISQDFRASFVHGDKGAAYQKYIMLHDTEGDGSAASVVDYWDGNGSGVAAHFVINKDGSIVQCVPMDKIAHHAGYGNTGNNALYGVTDESRDDKVGTTPIGSWAADYGMNSYSIGIELVHVGGSGGYPEAQLDALDGLIAYIDSYYGFQSQIIDHKAWRSGNSDTSAEFAGYLASYQSIRRHA